MFNRIRLLIYSLLSAALLSSCAKEPSPVQGQSVSDSSSQQTKTTDPASSTGRLDWKTGTFPTAGSDVLSPSMRTDPLQYMALGNKALLVSDYKSAYLAASKAVALNPQMSEAYCLKGKSRYLMSNGNQQESIDDLKRSIKLNPRLSDGYEYLGMIYDSNKEYGKAIDILSAG